MYSIFEIYGSVILLPSSYIDQVEVVKRRLIYKYFLNGVHKSDLNNDFQLFYFDLIYVNLTEANCLQRR
jgi:hypothetical protein